MLKIHTFEMKKYIKSNSEIQALRKRMWDLHYEKKDTDASMQLKYTGLCRKGIKLYIRFYKFKNYNEISLVITPQTVLGENGKQTLFIIDKGRLEECFLYVKQTLAKYEMDLNTFIVSRIDFTRDIVFEANSLVDTYIKLLRKTGAPMRYSETVYKSEKGELVHYKNTFDISSTNGHHSVVVYNKEKQYVQMEGDDADGFMKGVMRVEVRMCTVDEAIYRDGKVYFDEIEKMEQCAEQIIKKVFVNGFYIKAGKAKKILQKLNPQKTVGKRKRNKIEKMLLLLDRIARHRSLYGCVRGQETVFSYETTQSVLNEFDKLAINPVAISAVDKIAILPDLKFLLELKDEKQLQRDYEFLTANKLVDEMPVYKLR